MDNELAARARALEEAFFYEEDQRLVESLREMRTLERASGFLAEVSGLVDTALLTQLARLGVTPSTAAGLALFPLVAVAWADGSIGAEEREALLAGLDDRLFFQTIDRDIIEAWLTLGPTPAMVETWEGLAKYLVPRLEPRERRILADEILGHARKVAQAQGGVLGLVTTSAAERAVLARLEGALS